MLAAVEGLLLLLLLFSFVPFLSFNFGYPPFFP